LNESRGCLLLPRYPSIASCSLHLGNYFGSHRSEMGGHWTTTGPYIPLYSISVKLNSLVRGLRRLNTSSWCRLSTYALWSIGLRLSHEQTQGDFPLSPDPVSRKLVV
jgi:hypothetical protein